MKEESPVRKLRQLECEEGGTEREEEQERQKKKRRRRKKTDEGRGWREARERASCRPSSFLVFFPPHAQDNCREPPPRLLHVSRTVGLLSKEKGGEGREKKKKKREREGERKVFLQSLFGRKDGAFLGRRGREKSEDTESRKERISFSSLLLSLSTLSFRSVTFATREASAFTLSQLCSSLLSSAWKARPVFLLRGMRTGPALSCEVEDTKERDRTRTPPTL